MRCLKANERVAAFWQGRGLAAMGADRPLDAAGHFTQALRLQPESKDSLDQLRWAVEEIKGSSLKHPTYLQAKALLSTYPEDRKPLKPPSKRPDRLTLVTPGRIQTIRDDEMPLPYYDRLEFVQAIAVPVADDTLAVDARAVEQALEVYVRIDDKTLLPVTVQRTSGTSEAVLPDLALVKVENVKFTPLQFAPDVKFQPGDVATLVSLSLYQEMEEAPRLAAARIAEIGDDGNPKLALTPSPGDAASPVLTADGRLVGIFAGRTAALAADGGPVRFHDRAALEPLLKKAGRSTYNLYGKPRQEVPPVEVKNRYFVLYATFGERFEQKLP